MSHFYVDWSGGFVKPSSGQVPKVTTCTIECTAEVTSVRCRFCIVFKGACLLHGQTICPRFHLIPHTALPIPSIQENQRQKLHGPGADFASHDCQAVISLQS